jgi:hypothetical protein
MIKITYIKETCDLGRQAIYFNLSEMLLIGHSGSHKKLYANGSNGIEYRNPKAKELIGYHLMMGNWGFNMELIRN